MKYFGGGGGSGGGLVTSVFARIGAVVAVLGDYTSSLVTNASSVSGSSVSDALDALLTALGLAGVKQGTTLGNSNSTTSLTTGALYPLLPSTINAARVYTQDRNGLPSSTPGSGSMAYFLCLDTTANQKTWANGGAGGGNIVVVPPSAAAAVYIAIDDGTNWVYVGQILVQ